jgi:pilus assembly protein CpaB
VAAVCALIAAGILIFAMASYRHNVDAEGNPQTVLVASGLIQKGTSGDAIASEQLFKATSIPGKQVTSGAIADTSLLRGKVAASDIYPGQQLTTADFAAAGGIIGELGPGQRAMTVSVDGSRGMVGQIQVGNHVDVYADLEPGSARSQSFVRLLLSDVPVMKAPTSSTGGLGSGGQNQQSVVTLKVNASQAGPLAFASDNGKLWLVLRPANATSAPEPTISVSSLLSGSAGGVK